MQSDSLTNTSASCLQATLRRLLVQKAAQEACRVSDPLPPSDVCVVGCLVVQHEAMHQPQHSSW